MNIIIARDDGGLTTMTIKDGCAVQEEITKWESTALGVKAVSWREIDISELPTSKRWRNAWKYNAENETIEVDLEKAKVCQKGIIKEKALERIDPTEDAAFLYASGDAKFKKLKAETEKLKIDKAKTLEDLYNLWPMSIEKRSINNTVAKDKRK